MTTYAGLRLMWEGTPLTVSNFIPKRWEESMKTQWTWGFQSSQYWGIVFVVILIFIVFRVFTLPPDK